MAEISIIPRRNQTIQMVDSDLSQDYKFGPFLDSAGAAIDLSGVDEWTLAVYERNALGKRSPIDTQTAGITGDVSGFVVVRTEATLMAAQPFGSYQYNLVLVNVTGDDPQLAQSGTLTLSQG